MKLFVYGTLDKHPLMKNTDFLFECETVDKYIKIENSFFPSLKYSTEQKGEHQMGKLYEVPEKDIKNIDEYEGVPDLFYRKEINVEFENIVVLAWCYFITEKINHKEG